MALTRSDLVENETGHRGVESFDRLPVGRDRCCSSEKAGQDGERVPPGQGMYVGIDGIDTASSFAWRRGSSDFPAHLLI